MKYQQDPHLFRKEIMALDKSQWIFIDEIQKLPLLLDEVQSLIEDKFIFILTDSSARKLKKSGANLLAVSTFSRCRSSRHSIVIKKWAENSIIGDPA